MIIDDSRLSGGSLVGMRRVFGRVAVLGMLAGLLPAIPPPFAEAQTSGPLQRMGELAVPASDILIPDPTAKTLMAIGNTGGTAPVLVRTFDPETLKEKARLTVPGYLLPGGSQGRPKAYAWHAPSRRLYLLAQSLTAAAPDVILQLEAGERFVKALPLAATTNAPGLTIQGMSYHAPTNRLYVAAQDPSGLVGSTLVQVNELDADTAVPTWPRPYKVESCQKLVQTVRQAAIVRGATGTELFVGCGTGNLVLTPEPGLPGVALVDFRDPANPTTTLYPVPGSYAAGQSLYDEEGGRYIMVSQGPNQPTQAAWVFDQAHRVFLGSMSAENLNVLAAEVAEASGRLYVAIDNALLVGSDRGMRLAQALKFPMPAINGYVTAVPFNRSVIVAQGPNWMNVRTVYRLDVDPYVPPPVSDPDAGTSDLAEGPGVAASYGADAKAFGVRVHEVAGINGVLQNVAPAQSNYWDNLKRPTGIPLNDGDRDTYFSRVKLGRLSPQEATASAMTADADQTTRADYATNARGTPWPYEEADCSDFGGGSPPDSPAGASVMCDQQGARVTAAAKNEGQGYDLAAGTPLFRSGHSEASSTLRRDPTKGMVVETMAIARNVIIAGVASFGEIESRAVTSAHGRPGTAKTSYTRTYRNVTMPGFKCGTAETEKCDPKDVVNRLGVLLGGKFQVEAPEYEAVATPRGAKASVLREPWQHQQDVALNNQADNELQIPALRVSYYNDNTTRSRVIVEFAATLADSGYRVFSVGFPLPSLEDFVAGSAIESLPDDFGFATTGDSAGVAGGLIDGSPGVIDPLPGDGSGDARLAAGSKTLLPGHGLRLLLSGRGVVILAALLWGLLMLPAFLASRRRYLLRVIGDTQ